MHDAGFTLVRLAWICGAGALVWDGVVAVSTHRPRGPRNGSGPTRWIGVVSACIVVSVLWLPWIEGLRPDGRVRSGSAWAELDPFSTVTITVLATAAALRLGGAVAPPPRWVVRTEAVSLVGLVGGNILIQATTDRGSHLLGWPWVAFAAAVVVAVLDVTRLGSSAAGLK